MTIHNILLHPFTWGLSLGLIFAVMGWYRIICLKMELKRFKRHLSDKLEIEAESLKKIRADQENLRRENENLRVRNAGLSELPDRIMMRDLEVYARAEKRMIVSAPGFAPAWENAKNASLTEIEAEESGKSIPKRVFSRLFSSPAATEEKALPPT